MSCLKLDKRENGTFFSNLKKTEKNIYFFSMIVSQPACAFHPIWKGESSLDQSHHSLQITFTVQDGRVHVFIIASEADDSEGKTSFYCFVHAIETHERVIPFSEKTSISF